MISLGGLLNREKKKFLFYHPQNKLVQFSLLGIIMAQNWYWLW